MPNLVKSRSREIAYHNDGIALTFDSHLAHAATEGPLKFQNGWNSINPNLAASRRNDFLR